MILKILKDACYQVLGFQNPLDTHPYGTLTLGQNLSDPEILWKTFIIKLKEKKSRAAYENIPVATIERGLQDQSCVSIKIPPLLIIFEPIILSGQNRSIASRGNEGRGMRGKGREKREDPSIRNIHTSSLPRRISLDPDTHRSDPLHYACERTKQFRNADETCGELRSLE